MKLIERMIPDFPSSVNEKTLLKCQFLTYIRHLKLIIEWNVIPLGLALRNIILLSSA